MYGGNWINRTGSKMDQIHVDPISFLHNFINFLCIYVGSTCDGAGGDGFDECVDQVLFPQLIKIIICRLGFDIMDFQKIFIELLGDFNWICCGPFNYSMNHYGSRLFVTSPLERNYNFLNCYVLIQYSDNNSIVATPIYILDKLGKCNILLRLISFKINRTKIEI